MEAGRTRLRGARTCTVSQAVHLWNMKKLPCRNDYQQLLLSALALVDEADLVAIFRAARNHAERNACIDLVNAELDRGISLWDAFDEPSALYKVFTHDWPELRVLVGLDDNTISMDFGTNGPPSSLVSWRATMGGTGVVTKLECFGRYYPGGIPPYPMGPDPVMGR